jgi:hypothetical protein
MGFQLRSQSPLNQKKDIMSQFGNSGKSKNIQKSLEDSRKIVSDAKANKKSISIGSKLSQDWDRQDPIVKSVIQLADPTGTTSYPDVKEAWNDNKLDYKDVTEPLGALPVIGKIPKLLKSGFRIAKSLSAVERVAKVANKVNNVTSKVNTASKASNVGKLGETVVTPLNQKKKSPLNQTNYVYSPDGIGSDSPLMKQKLSPKAAKAKAARDLAAAKTPDRRNKKAHSQRMHRKDPKGKGKDWDHEDGRWESVKQNRGNEGEGTKKESGKRYRIK